MENMIILSVIVPVYNVERYIQFCLLSICRQTLNPNSYEIIVVNDGSTDRSEEIILQLKKVYPHIKYIVQESKKAGGARNTGIKESKGKYILFVDADDFLRYKNALEILLNYSENNEIDLLWCSTYLSDFQNEELIKFENHSNIGINIITGKYILEFLPFSVAVWQFLIKKEFLETQNLMFLEGIYYEDTDFTIRLLFQSDRVGMIDFSYYVYRYNESSYTNKPALAVFKDNCKSVILLDELIRDSVKVSSIKSSLRKRIKKSLMSYVRISKQYSINESLDALSNIRKHRVFDLEEYNLNTREFLVLFSLKHCPYIVLVIVRLYSAIIITIKNIAIFYRSLTSSVFEKE